MTDKKRVKVPMAEVMPATAVARTVPTSSVHPGTMIQAMINTHKDIDLVQMQGLFELQKAYDDEIARKAYNAAKARFSAMAPSIITDGHAKFAGRNSDNTTEYKFATLAGTMDQIREALKECELNVSWKIGEKEDGRLAVTCFLTHSMGYQEETQLSATRDAGKGSTGMKSLQAVKSTTTYLERITMYALLGLASRDEDNDGADGGDNFEVIDLITDDQALQIHSKITDNELGMEGILNWLAKSQARCATIEDIPAEFFLTIMSKLDAAVRAKQT
jgi:hypothetical protein